MPPSNVGLRTGAIVCFVFAGGGVAAAHPRPTNAIDGVRLVGADLTQPDGDAYTTGKRLLAGDDIAGALAAFERALAETPGSPDALNGIGVSYDRLGRPDLARTFYEAGLAADPTSPSLLNNLGYSLYLQGNYGAAVVPLRAAAASSDLAAAATASATLAMLVTQVSTRLLDAKRVTASDARIEVTNGTEQRLVLDPGSDASNSAPVSDTAVEVSVAAAWTEDNDRTLLAQVRADEHAEEVALMSADGSEVEAVPQPVPTQAAAAPAPLAGPSRTMTAVAITHAVGPASTMLVSVDEASAAILARRRVVLSVRDVTTTGGGPGYRATPAIFESDDAELNAFAARVRAASLLARVSAEGDRGRIAARFRA